MRKYGKLIAAALSITLTAVVVTGCGAAEKTKNADTSSESKDEKIDYDACVTLGKYDEISLKKTDIDASVQEKIENLRKENATYEQIKKGKVKSGDTVNIFYVGKVNGKEFEGGSYTKEINPDGFNLTIGSKQFIDGFEDALIGKKAGGTYDINVTFPSVYSANSELAGKPAVFTVTINYIQGKENLPEFNDAFVKSKISGYEKAEEYKSFLRKSTIQDMAWDQVYNDAKVKDYPESKLKSMEKQLETSITYYLKQQGVTVEDYIKQQGSTSEKFQEEMTATAKDDVGKQLIYGAIAEKENITVSDEEYQKELKNYLTNYNCKDEDELNDKFQEYYGVSANSIIRDDQLYQKVKAFLVSNVKEV